MRVGEWLQPQRQLLLAVVVVAVLSAGALGWLGWLLVQQDGALERQRQADRLQQAADRAASAMRLALADLLARAAQPGDSTSVPAAGLLRADLDAASVTLHDRGAVLWVPGPAATADTGLAVFGAAESQEFGGDLGEALQLYLRWRCRPTAVGSRWSFETPLQIARRSS